MILEDIFLMHTLWFTWIYSGLVFDPFFWTPCGLSVRSIYKKLVRICKKKKKKKDKILSSNFQSRWNQRLTFGLRVKKDLISKKKSHSICLFPMTINSTLPNTMTLYLVKKSELSCWEMAGNVLSAHQSKADY